MDIINIMDTINIGDEAVIKVLYLLNHAGSGGTERYVRTLVEQLNNNKIKAYFAYNEEGLLVDELKALGVNTFRVELKSRFDIKAAIRLAKLCKKLDIDLIHTQFLRENYIALLSRLFNPRVRVVYTNHMIVENDLFTRFTNRLLMPFEAGVIAVCSKGRETMINNGVGQAKIKVIFNAVDSAYWGKSDESSLRSEFNITMDTFVLICVSRFSAEKGHSFLIRSIAELKKICDVRFKCVLAGNGALLGEIKQLAGELGVIDDIIFAGFRKDIRNLLHGSDLFINPSETEALSYAIIEALASGLPVIASDVGGNGDIINRDTNCGILVRYGDEKEMAAVMYKLMSDRELYATLKGNAIKAADEIFNLVKMSNGTYNLYKEFIEGK